MLLFDSHVHLADDLLFPEWEAILERALKGGVDKLLVITTNPGEMNRALMMKNRYPDHLFVSASITPHEAHTASETEIAEIEAAAKSGFLDAVGETGLEYFYLKETKNKQIALLERTLSLANALDLPVVFHCREAFDDLFPFLDTYKPKGILHCFTGTAAEAITVVQKGLYLSFSGILTYPKSTELRSAAANLPLDKLLVETDAPFLAPKSKRGKTNEPLFIQETLLVLAEILGKPPEEVAKATYHNAYTLLR